MLGILSLVIATSLLFQKTSARPVSSCFAFHLHVPLIPFLRQIGRLSPHSKPPSLATLYTVLSSHERRSDGTITDRLSGGAITGPFISSDNASFPSLMHSQA